MTKLALLTVVVLLMVPLMVPVVSSGDVAEPVLVGPRLLLLGTDSPKKVFVTSAPYYGTLGGVTGADQICNSLAQAVGLSGTFMAWISDENTSPQARFTKSQKGYLLVDGTMIAENWDDLTDYTLMHAKNMDESGVTISNYYYVWTGTYDNGFAEGEDCSNWTSPNGDGLAGNATVSSYHWQTDTNWSVDTIRACNSQNRLYCFEQ